MSIPVTINGTTFQVPENLEQPGWGTETSDYLVELGTIANEVIGPGDIADTAFTVANNQTSPANIVGLAFDTTVIQGTIVEYCIYRQTSTSSVAEAGNMTLVFNTKSATWEFSRYSAGDAGLVFSFSGNQMTYTSSNLSGTGYTGKMTFRSKGFLI